MSTRRKIDKKCQLCNSLIIIYIDTYNIYNRQIDVFSFFNTFFLFLPQNLSLSDNASILSICQLCT